VACQSRKDGARFAKMAQRIKMFVAGFVDSLQPMNIVEDEERSSFNAEP